MKRTLSLLTLTLISFGFLQIANSQDIPSTPTLSSPSNGSTQTTLPVYVSWSDVPDANNYWLQVATDNNFNSLVYDEETYGYNDEDLYDLNSGTTYYWRVSAGNDAGWSSYSSARSFLYQIPLPSAPSLISPSNSTTLLNQIISFTWNSVSNASEYWLQVANDPNFSSSSLFVDQSTGGSTGKNGVGVDYGSTYYWRVKAYNNAGWGTYSSVWSFILPPQPQITTITPNKVPAGDIAVVTINGTNFDYNQGNGSVKFLHNINDAAQQFVEACDIISWSNTQIICTVPANASSGPVVVTNNEQVQSSQSYQFAVSYGYGNLKWPTTHVKYRVNENLSGYTGVLTAINAAASSWNNAYALFSLDYDSPCSTTSLNTSDAYNDIFWGTPSDPTANAETWTSSANGTIYSCDVVFNNNRNWTNLFDIQTIALHEFGHWLKLTDLYGDIDNGTMNDKAKVMYGINNGGQKRSLQSDDIAGIQYIYGVGNVTGIGGGGTPTTFPQTPTNIQATISGQNVVITFNEVTNGIVNFNVYRNNIQIGNASYISSQKYGYTDNNALQYFPSSYYITVTNSLGTTASVPIIFPSSTINSSTNWSGVVYITSNVTLSSGNMLAISSGASLSFANGASLIVNGTLVANGTSTQRITFDRSGTTGNWGGIQFNNSTTPSTVQYCNINNASTGIYLYNSSNVKIGYNTISGGTYGINCQSYSGPFIYNNTITGCSAAGVICGVYSSPMFGNPYIGNSPAGAGHNIIKQNGMGISAGINSNPALGAGTLFGYNSIYSNTNGEISTYHCPGTLMAQNNWWNRTSSPYYTMSDFSLDGGTINCSPSLSSDPNGSLQGSVKGSAGGIQNVSLSKDVIAGSTAAAAVDISGDDELTQLMVLDWQGKNNDAIAGYTQRFKKETNREIKKYILARLAECYRSLDTLGTSTAKKDFTDFLTKEVRQKVASSDVLYAASLEVENMLLLREGNYDGAIENFKKLRSTFSTDKDIHKNALFNLGYLYYYQLNDSVKGKAYLDELKADYPGDALTLQAMVLRGETTSSAMIAAADSSEAVAVIPENYVLQSNYPNPFNPTTNINYQLPENARVSLKVYDILGREVATLADGMKEAGIYTATFDGSRFASGMYFARFIVNPATAGSPSNGKPIVQVKKMLMIK
jgi:parallel beta-helix repeat protein